MRQQQQNVCGLICTFLALLLVSGCVSSDAKNFIENPPKSKRNSTITLKKKPGVRYKPVTLNRDNQVMSKPSLLKVLKPGQSKKITRADIHASILYYNTLNVVRANVVAIASVTPTQAFINRSHLFFTDTDGSISEAWSEGNFTVNQVYFIKSGTNLAAGQSVSVAEPVGLVDEGAEGYLKIVKGDSLEMRQNTPYLVFLFMDERGVLRLANFNRGHFNTNGTDPEDEIGGAILPDGTKTDKQKLREELTALYGVQFNFLPQVRISQAYKYTEYGIVVFVPGSGFQQATQDFVRVDAEFQKPQVSGSSLQIEKQDAYGNWTLLQSFPVDAAATTGTGTYTKSYYVSIQPVGTMLRARVTHPTGNRTSNYSTAVEYTGTTPPP